MAGVPRIVANGLADIWKQKIADEPKSYEGIREWVANLSDRDWQKALPLRYLTTRRYAFDLAGFYRGKG